MHVISIVHARPRTNTCHCVRSSDPVSLAMAILDELIGNCFQDLTVIETAERSVCVAHPGYLSLSLNYHLGKRAVLLS